MSRFNMKKFLILCIGATLAIACNKDKFQTKPQIKVKSLSSEIVPLNSALRLVLEYTDKEGDLADSLIFVRQRLNIKGPKIDTIPLFIPSFPDTKEGEVQVDLRYADYLTFNLPAISIPGTGGQREADTLNLKFVVVDDAGNKSDTATTGVIVIRN